MPERILRDWTDSKTMNSISFQEEVLFTRLIMKADDYGNFHGDPLLLKSLLFPRKDGLRISEITAWLETLKSAQLIREYHAKSDTFLHILNFKQRLRQKKRKFPEPPEEIELENSPADCQQIARIPRVEEKGREEEGEEKGSLIYPLEKTKEMFFGDRDLIEYTVREKHCSETQSKDYLHKFWSRQEASGKITTRSYSDLKSHYVNSVPHLKLSSESVEKRKQKILN